MIESKKEKRSDRDRDQEEEDNKKTKASTPASIPDARYSRTLE